MIRIETLRHDDARHHFAVTADEPMRIEVTVADGHVVAHGYLGAEVDLDQEPDVAYDSDNDENRSFARRGRADAGFEAVPIATPAPATVDAGNLAGVLDRAEAIERDRDEARAALAALATYFDEQLEVTDSPGTRQTLEIHRNIARRALAERDALRERCEHLVRSTTP